MSEEVIRLILNQTYYILLYYLNQLRKLKFQRKPGFFEDFAHNSTVTGLVYFFDSRHWTEKICWLAMLVGSIGCVAVSTRSVYISWQDDPTMMVHNDRKIHVWEIPFPAITVCPTAKRKTVKFCKRFPHLCHELDEHTRGRYDAKDTYKMHTSYSDVAFRYSDFVQNAAALVCHKNTSFRSNQRIADADAYKTIHKIALKRDNTLGYCMHSRQLSCELMFYETMTDEGLCFTFNMLKNRDIFRDTVSSDFDHQLQHGINTDWTGETGYSSFVLQNIDLSYPVRVVGTKLDDYNVVAFSLTHHIDNERRHCDHPLSGHKILLHSPDEYPFFTKHNFHTITIDQIVEIFINPRIIQTSDELRYSKPQARKCFFNSERHLRFYKIYNQRNCQLECLANVTLHVCGCVSFALPRNQTTPICGLGATECYKEIKEQFFDNSLPLVQRDHCDCLPKCSSISYVDIDYQVVYESGVNPAFSLSQMLLSFKQNEFQSHKRISRTGTMDFLSYSAGLLGLYTGMSMLSVVEVFYYFIVRWVCCYRCLG